LPFFFIGLLTWLGLLVQPVFPVTINLFTYYLYENDCTTFLADGSTVLVIASTANSTFGALSAGTGAPADSFTDEPDDVVVGRLTFDSETMGLPGAFASAISFNLGENGVAAGNPLLFVWYSGLQESTNPSAPGAGRAYGVFRDSSWVVPASNSDLIQLVMATPAAGADLGDVPTATELEGCARFVTSGQANRPPVAQCQLLVKVAGTNCTATATANEVDNGSLDPDADPITLALDPPGPYALGSNIVALVVVDSNGLTNLCVTTIVVTDNTPPTVTCLAEVIAQAGTGETEAVATFDPPVASDNCGIASVVAVPPSGSLFPLGTNSVTWTATDTSGNTNSCQMLVIVRELTDENDPPTAICHNITRPAGTNCQASVTAAEVNNGSFDPDGNPITLALNPPGPFAIGNHAVTLIVADDRGGTNTCAATVSVVDAMPPSISCPAPVVAQAPGGATESAVEYPAPAASDGCTSVTVTSLPASGAAFPIGTNTVNVTAVDAAGNTNTCSFTVTVLRGNAAPTMQCQNIVRPANGDCVATVTAAEVDNGSFDLDGDPFTLSLVPPGPYAVGTNAVALVGVDNQGNTNSCAALIIVTDQTPPVLVGCPVNFAVNAAFGATNAVVTYIAPTATDTCSRVTVISEPPSGATLPLGTNTVVCTAVDGAGNTSICEFTVVVRGGGSVARDLAVTKIRAPRRVRLSTSQSTVTVPVAVTIQNLGLATETIETLEGLVTLVAESLAPTVCPDRLATLSTGKQAKLPVALKPKQKLRVMMDVTYAVTCIPDLRQTTKRENFDDYRYVATVDRSVLDGDGDAVPANDTLTGPVTDVVVWFW